MHDQGIEARAALGGKNAGHGLAAGGVGAQAINGFGGEGDQSPPAQNFRRARDRGGIGGGNPADKAIHKGLVAGRPPQSQLFRWPSSTASDLGYSSKP